MFQSRKYTFIIPTLPFLNYFVQETSIPQVSTNSVAQSNPGANAWRFGDKLAYDPLTITVALDEDLRVWEETYNWLVALTHPREYPQYWQNTNGRQVPYHDAILTINTNANNPNIRIKFTNIHPMSLGSVELKTTVSAEETQTTDITFRYDQLIIERLT